MEHASAGRRECRRSLFNRSFPGRGISDRTFLIFLRPHAIAYAARSCYDWIDQSIMRTKVMLGLGFASASIWLACVTILRPEKDFVEPGQAQSPSLLPGKPVDSR